VSVAAEAVGIRHAIPCFLCPPDAVETVHVVRSTGAASVVVQVNIYDVNGIVVGNFIQADPAGTFQARQIAFLSSTALAANNLAAGLFAGVLFDASLATALFYEQIAIGPGGISGVLTGRGNLYNYFTAAVGGAWALVLYPEIGGGGALTGLVNFFVCNNPANNMATFLGVPGAAPGAQGVAQLVTVNGDLIVNNFATQNLFGRPLTAISPSGNQGGSLRLLPPGAGAAATVIACLKFVRIASLNSTVGNYTY
jgi:hypothetical protein